MRPEPRFCGQLECECCAMGAIQSAQLAEARREAEGAKAAVVGLTEKALRYDREIGTQAQQIERLREALEEAAKRLIVYRPWPERIETALAVIRAALNAPAPGPGDTMLGQPITEVERDRISKDGP